MHLFGRRRVCALVAVVLLLGSGRAAARESGSEAESAAPRTKQRAFGDAGDVVLQDLIGVRTSSAPNRAPYAAAPPGTDGVGTLDDSGPSVSAGWLDVWISKVGFDGGASRVSRTIRFEPSADVFVATRISLGGSVGVAVGSFRNPGFSRSVEGVALSLDPRIGYLITISDVFALWPRVRAGITVDPTDGAIDAVGWRLGADLPVVVRVSSHVLLNCGPEITYAVSDAGSLTSARSFHLAGRGGLSVLF